MKTINRIYLYPLLLGVLLMLVVSCSKKDDNNNNNSTVTDFDGNVYHTVTIGPQTWMKENLNVVHYNNGDPIPNITDNTAWSNLTTGAYINYENTSSYVNTYGRLYNWYAVNDARKICPTSWHVTSDSEWNIMEKYLDNTVDTAATGYVGTDIGNKLKESGTSHWTSGNDGTNSSNFTALPGGCRYGNGLFSHIHDDGFWWTSSEYDDANSWSRGTYYNNTIVDRNTCHNINGISVRCVKD
jgi:uncharacterized protein (TIGR02145 family)